MFSPIYVHRFLNFILTPQIKNSEPVSCMAVKLHCIPRWRLKHEEITEAIRDSKPSPTCSLAWVLQATGKRVTLQSPRTSAFPRQQGFYWSQAASAWAHACSPTPACLKPKPNDWLPPSRCQVTGHPFSTENHLVSWVRAGLRLLRESPLVLISHSALFKQTSNKSQGVGGVEWEVGDSEGCGWFHGVSWEPLGPVPSNIP